MTTQFFNLTLTSFHHENQYPCLSGRGAGIKDIVRAIHALLQAHCTPESQKHKLVLVMLENWCLLQDIFADCRDGMSLDLDLATLLAKHVDKVWIDYSLLANSADEHG